MTYTKYHRWHDQIIIRAKRRRKLDGYFELHHVKPRCLGGCHTPSNLVFLSLREHFLVHWLLTKMHTEGRARGKIALAFFAMGKNTRSRPSLTDWQKRLCRRPAAELNRVVSADLKNLPKGWSRRTEELARLRNEFAFSRM